MRTIITGSPYAAEEPEDWGKRGTWRCAWVAVPEPVAAPFVSAYRCRFDITENVVARVHVTADERYELFLNGERIGRGSERGDGDNWYFETYDLALTSGAHTLVARVWSLGAMAPFAQMTVHPGFLLAPQAHEFDALIGTGFAAWEAKILPGYAFIDPITAWGTGANLIVDGGIFPWGFERGDGEGWQAVRVLKPGTDFLWRNEMQSEHMLRPAVLPPMLDVPFSGGQVRHVEAVESARTHDVAVRAEHHLSDEADGWQRLVAGTASVTVPANTRRRVLVDLRNYVCAYPELTASGGAGGLVRVHWQESLYSDLGANIKGNRDDVEGKYFGAVWRKVDGIGDTFLPDGGINRRFETLWWQCGRYIELLVETRDEPLTIERLALRETRYPLEMEAAFASSDARWDVLIPLTLRTLQLCAHETYMDCPYFEQLMYIGDTRLQALVTYAITADDRLPRKAVELLGASRLLTGLTQSRYPGRVRQIIPPFSLWWVGMLYDYALWRGDPDFVRALMPTARGVIDFFLRQRGADGVVVSPKGWNVQDWVPEWKGGVPPDGYDGVNGLLNWEVAYALERAAELETWLGEPELAARDRRLSRELVARIEATFWDGARGLYAEDAAHGHYSEHTQCVALLSGSLDDARRETVFASLIAAPDLARATVYFSHYLFEAYHAVGRADLFAARLSLWHDLKADGLFTTIEQPEPTRSDCHAWGAHPLYQFLASTLGVRPGAMGFATVHIAPNPGALTTAKGRVVHPLGMIEVAIERGESGTVVTVTLPGDLTGVFAYAGQEVALGPGGQRLEFAPE